MTPTPTHKALTPAGEWVEGWFDYSDQTSPTIWMKDKSTGIPETVLPETVCIATPIKDRNKNTVFVGDEVVDGMSNMKYIVKFGYCKKYAFTGFYVESYEGREAPINNDSGEEYNHYITLTSKNIHDKPRRSDAINT